MIRYYKNWDYDENKCMCGVLGITATDSWDGDVDPYKQMGSSATSTLDICPSYENIGNSYGGSGTNTPCTTTNCVFSVSCYCPETYANGWSDTSGYGGNADDDVTYVFTQRSYMGANVCDKSCRDIQTNFCTGVNVPAGCDPSDVDADGDCEVPTLQTDEFSDHVVSDFICG